MYKCVNLLPLTLNLHAQHTAADDLYKEKERKLTCETNSTPVRNMLPYEHHFECGSSCATNKIVCVPKQNRLSSKIKSSVFQNIS